LRILFVGDIFGSPGRKIVRDHIHHIVESNSIELVVMNAENAAGGFGVTPSIAEELFEVGADVLTTGNHVWDKKEIIEFFNSSKNSANGNVPSMAKRVLRPANYPAGTPGTGLYEGKTKSGVPYAVMNLQGRVFMANNDDPFRVADGLLQGIKAKVILVDMHAEATSEKMAMGWYLDGRVTAVLGTHTHVPTADERILPKGTAYQTDVGMSGPYDSIIGVEKEMVLQRFLTSMPAKFEAAKNDPRLCGVVIECDTETGQASSIRRLMLGQ
jgi:2',3'-cyclic-nucleotide 2'-phosphodiesterase